MTVKFDYFVHQLKLAWETEECHPKSRIKVGHYFIEEAPKAVYVYKFNHNCVSSRFEDYRCYIDDKVLFNILRDILPQFLEYFSGKKNFTFGNWVEDEEF